jgi:hypothetical protein
VFNPPDNIAPVQGCVIFTISYWDSVSNYAELSRSSTRHQHKKNGGENQDKLGKGQGDVKVITLIMSGKKLIHATPPRCPLIS